MANQITGKVLSVGQPLQVPGKDPARPIIRREIIIDCTRYDPYTGERSKFENTPSLEFSGDLVNELDSILPGDVVTISFDLVGTRYIDKTTKQQKVFTRPRPYRIEKRQQVAQAPQPQPASPQQYQPAPLPFPPFQDEYQSEKPF